MSDDPFDLARFIAAQDAVLPQVREELTAGRKATHWMWFVFPQLRALGRSATALHYGITGRAEAEAYLAHPVLGPRLADCTALVEAVPCGTLEGIFGSVDALKFRSCMTLFDAVQPGAIFAKALARWCGGAPDARTLALLAQR